MTPDAEMRLALYVPIPLLLAEYRASCEQLRRLMAPMYLDNASWGTLSWREKQAGVYARTGSRDALAAAIRAAQLIGR